MKNPWMSAWLSAANSVTGPARGQAMAEISKAQTQMMQEWQRNWFDACARMWSPQTWMAPNICAPTRRQKK